MAILAAICFIVCHGGPADHFATFAEALSDVEIFASGPALRKCEERGVEVAFPFCAEGLSPQEEDILAEQIARKCSTASLVVTDLGHNFAVKVQKALASYGVPRFAYYDNPEPYVPGGYSAVAAEVMSIAQGVLFANATLIDALLYRAPGQEIDLVPEKKWAIGYYPLDRVEDLRKRRAVEHVSGKVLVYFGGNNEEYFSKAFPAFLALLDERLEGYEILIHQHPGAKDKNHDGKMLLEWKEKHPQIAIALSDFQMDEVLIRADAILYYQTSMSPQFMLAGIPTIQIGHEPFEDILVRNGVCPSVTQSDQLVKALEELQTDIPQELLLEGLGIKTNWRENLKAFVNTQSQASEPQELSDLF